MQVCNMACYTACNLWVYDSYSIPLEPPLGSDTLSSVVVLLSKESSIVDVVMLLISLSVDGIIVVVIVGGISITPTQEIAC